MNTQSITFGRKELPHLFLSDLAGLGQEAPQIVCGWCGTELRPGPLPASHGICHPCLQEQREHLRLLKETGRIKPLAAAGAS